jgi:hypothetical protein
MARRVLWVAVILIRRTRVDLNVTQLTTPTRRTSAAEAQNEVSALRLVLARSTGAIIDVVIAVVSAVAVRARAQVRAHHVDACTTELTRATSTLIDLVAAAISFEIAIASMRKLAMENVSAARYSSTSQVALRPEASRTCSVHRVALNVTRVPTETRLQLAGCFISSCTIHRRVVGILAHTVTDLT